MTNEEAIKILSKVTFYWELGEQTLTQNQINEAIDMAIKALEIELLTDREQRIFLKAINREREVCQKVDDEYSDNDSRVSLVKVCNSIERKVKKIWE